MEGPRLKRPFPKEGMSLKKIKKHNILFWLALVMIVAFFVVMLVFMTDFYNFYYDGTAETGQFFKELQVLNKFAFNQSLVLVVGILLVFAADLKIYRGSLGASVILVALTIYQVIRMLTVVPTINYFVGGYQNLDLTSALASGHQLGMLQLSNILEIGITVVLVLLTAQCIYLWLKQRKQLSGEVAHG